MELRLGFMGFVGTPNLEERVIGVYILYGVSHAQEHAETSRGTEVTRREWSTLVRKNDNFFPLTSLRRLGLVDEDVDLEERVMSQL